MIMVRLVAVAILNFGGFSLDTLNQKYSVEIDGEDIVFVAQPKAGYVVKQSQTTSNIGILADNLSAEGGDIKRVAGKGRRGMWIVESDGHGTRNEETVQTLGDSSSVEYSAPLFSVNGETVAVIPEIVVRLKDKDDGKRLQELCPTLNLAIIKRMEFTELEYLIEILGPDADAVFEAVQHLNEVDWIKWAYPNTASQVHFAGPTSSTYDSVHKQYSVEGQGDGSATQGVLPNDEYFPNQWHLHNTGQSGGTPGADINAPKAWEITTGDPNIIIAVIDQSIDMNHPDLIDNLMPGYNVYADAPESCPETGPHGTICAGLASARGNNGIGVTGVTWRCRIMPVRLLCPGQVTSEADMATAIRWAAANGADVLTNSWGHNRRLPICHEAIKDVTSLGGLGRGGKGCVVLFAGGNFPDGGPVAYPAAYPETIGVGGTDKNDIACYYGSHGPELDIVAPTAGEIYEDGVAKYIGDIWSTDRTGSAGENNRNPAILDYTDKMGGTSASTPIAAGVAALILSANPALTNIEVQRILYRSAKDLGESGWDQYYGYGRVDAYAAVQMALNPPPPQVLLVDDDAPNDPGPGDPNISDPAEDGSSEHPFDSIQEAIDYAYDSEVVVLPGTYTGKGNYDIDFRGKPITVRSEDGPQSCTIDCQGLGRAFTFDSIEGTESILHGFTITGGTANNGGAISCTNGSSPTICNCVLTGNSATSIGGAMYIANSGPRIVNCTLTNSNAALMGGAIVSTNGTSTITNSIIWNNTPDQMFIYGDCSVSYCNIAGGLSGEGNIDLDPLFADPTNGEFHLESEAGRWDPSMQSWIRDDAMSPCIDAGDPKADWTSELWPHGKRINMGAYGGTQEASMSLSQTGNPADLNCDNIVDIADYSILADQWLFQHILSASDLNRDGVVSFVDYAQFAAYWLAVDVQ